MCSARRSQYDSKKLEGENGAINQAKLLPAGIIDVYGRPYRLLVSLRCAAGQARGRRTSAAYWLECRTAFACRAKSYTNDAGAEQIEVDIALESEAGNQPSTAVRPGHSTAVIAWANSWIEEASPRISVAIEDATVGPESSGADSAPCASTHSTVPISRFASLRFCLGRQ